MNKIKEIWSNTGDVILRYPMVIVMSFIAAITAVLIIDNHHQDTYFEGLKILILTTMGISLMFSLKMLSQRNGKSFLLEILGTLFLLGYYFLFPKTEKEFNEVYAFLIIPTYILLHLCVAFIPFLGRKNENNFWQYNKNLFIKIFLTAIFTGVLVGGVELALLAVEKLFDLKYNYLIYPRTMAFLSIFGSTFIFLLFVNKGLEDLEKETDYPQILKFFTQFILIPLLFIYLVILYVYSAKILFLWELPRGWVSYLILAYSIVGIFALLLVHPLKEIGSKSWVKIFSKIFYFSLLPLLTLLFVAIFTRILEYGYTEPRYFVVLLAVWLATVVIYFILVKKNTIQYIPISLFAFGVFALCFPFLNTFSVAKKSQLKQLNQILEKNKLLDKGKINFSKPINDSVSTEVADKISFLTQRKEYEFLKPLVKDSLYYEIKEEIKQGSYWVGSTIKNEFSNISYNENSRLSFQEYKILSDNKFSEIGSFDYCVNLSFIEQESVKLPNGDAFFLNFKSYQDSKEMLLILNEKEKINLYPKLKALFPNIQDGNKKLPEISISGQIGKYEFKIIFESVRKTKHQGEEEKIHYENGQLFIKLKK